MINRNFQPNHCGSDLQRVIWMPTIVTLLVASLVLFSAVVVAQDAEQPSPKSQTLKVKVVDEKGGAIEGASLRPLTVQYLRGPDRSTIWRPGLMSRDHLTKTNEQGEATLDFPENEKGPIAQVSIQVKHASFGKKLQRVSFDDDDATIVLQRGFQIAATAIAPVTKERIEENLYAITNRRLPVDWELKTNGTLVSPVIGKDETSFRLVQVVDGKAIRFSKLTEIVPGNKSRLRFNDLEMIDSVTVSGTLGDEVPRPVRSGRVTALVASVGKADSVPNSYLPSWSWSSYSRVDKDGTFTLEGIPADSVLQICCSCNGWANKPLTKDEIATEFPKDTNGLLYYQLPQIARIGMQATNITVPMHPVGTLTVKVVDQDDQPFKHALVTFSPRQKFFYWRSNGLSDTSLIRLLRLRPTSENNNAMRRLDFPTKELYSRIKPDRTGTVIIEEVPPGKVSVSASTPEYESGDDEGRVRKVVAVKAEENVEIKLTLNRIEAEDGGDE